MKWMEMAWPDLREVDREGTVVIAPLGSMEQHSRHLPAFTDSLIIEAIADRLNDRLGEKVLILPVQWLGLSLHHMAFGATVSAELDTHADMVFDMGASVLTDDYRKLLLLNGHGGNAIPLDVAVQELSIDFPEASVVWASYWNVAAKEITRIRDSEIGGIGHAGEMETSILLHIRPDLVHNDRLAKDGVTAESEFLWKDITRGGSVNKYQSFAEITTHGGFGDPTLATAEKGEKFLEAAADCVARVVEEMREGKL